MARAFIHVLDELDTAVPGPLEQLDAEVRVARPEHQRVAEDAGQFAYVPAHGPGVDLGDIALSSRRGREKHARENRKER